MQYYKHMAMFVVVVDTGSFTAAATRLGTAKSAVSRYVSELEEHLGVVLLQRTTRQFSITEAGQRYYESCARMVAEAEAAEEAVRDLRSEATGTLRVSAPVSFGIDIIMPALIEFTDLYPKLDVNVTLDNRAIDLVEEGIDLGVRFGHVTSPSLMARQLSATTSVICGAPDYFHAHGIPEVPRDLTSHKWLPAATTGSEKLTFKQGEQTHSVTLNGRFRTNNGDAVLAFLRTGKGIAQYPLWGAYDDLVAGRLKIALADYLAPELSINAVYPATKHVLPRVRLFIDHLAEKFVGRDWLSISNDWIARAT